MPFRLRLPSSKDAFTLAWTISSWRGFARRGTRIESKFLGEIFPSPSREKWTEVDHHFRFQESSTYFVAFLSGTTVSGTLVVANQMGNGNLFVTGGIGGVHRGGQDSMDISADLVELGRTKSTVISAGAKSILDIGRTLEYLV